MNPALTDAAYKLIGMERPEPAPQSLVITPRDRVWRDPQCCGGEEFNWQQTRYQGIPEHLIEARDHD